jgi:hypothetical protein
VKCNFCGCTDRRPCLIPGIVDADGDDRDAVISFGAIAIVGPDQRIEMIPCSWLIPDVCTAPACVEKAYLEARPFAEKIELGAYLAARVDEVA